MGIKVGIIGCGSITKLRHAPEYKANPYVDEIVFYDRNPRTSRSISDHVWWTVEQTVEELLADPTIQVISDCSSNESHHIFSTKALLNGKHVLCEKPISLTIEHAKDLFFFFFSACSIVKRLVFHIIHASRSVMLL